MLLLRVRDDSLSREVESLREANGKFSCENARMREVDEVKGADLKRVKAEAISSTESVHALEVRETSSLAPSYRTLCHPCPWDLLPRTLLPYSLPPLVRVHGPPLSLTLLPYVLSDPRSVCMSWSSSMMTWRSTT